MMQKPVSTPALKKSVFLKPTLSPSDIDMMLFGPGVIEVTNV